MMYALRADTLIDLLEAINKEHLTKEDIVQIFTNSKGEYIVIYIHKEHGHN